MHIDKAIRTGKEILGSSRLDHWPEAEVAVQLGVEALKQIKEAQNYQLILSEAKLPGQTED